MAWTDDDYLRLGDQMRAARRSMSFKTLKQFQDYLDAMEEGQVSGRTYADIETGKLRSRARFSAESFAFLEDVFEWYPGACRAILDGRNVDPYSGIIIPGPVESVRTRFESRVGTSADDEDTLLFKRPEGLSDEAWERLRVDHEDYWQWLLDKASRER